MPVMTVSCITLVCKIRTLRMARGYAPYSQFGYQAKTITLALGAQQKSTIALALPKTVGIIALYW